jgi:hypothetical protein
VRTIVNRRGIVVGLALLATVGMTACSANRTPSNAGPGTGQTSVPAATAAASQSAAAPSPTPTGIQNLVISSAEKSDLTTAFVAMRGISLSDIAGGGPEAGSVYYGYDPSTDTYWALANFAASSTASMNAQIGFQDGGGTGMFKKAGATGAWQATRASFPEICGEVTYFPAAVLMAWSISTTSLPPACQGQ